MNGALSQKNLKKIIKNDKKINKLKKSKLARGTVREREKKNFKNGDDLFFWASSIPGEGNGRIDRKSTSLETSFKPRPDWLWLHSH